MHKAEAASGKYEVQQIGGNDKFNTANLICDDLRKTIQLTQRFWLMHLDMQIIGRNPVDEVIRCTGCSQSTLLMRRPSSIQKHNNSKVVIVGGTAVVTQTIENYLKSLSISVNRIAGYTM